MVGWRQAAISGRFRSTRLQRRNGRRRPATRPSGQGMQDPVSDVYRDDSHRIRCEQDKAFGSGFGWRADRFQMGRNQTGGLLRRYLPVFRRARLHRDQRDDLAHMATFSHCVFRGRHCAVFPGIGLHNGRRVPARLADAAQVERSNKRHAQQARNRHRSPEAKILQTESDARHCEKEMYLSGSDVNRTSTYFYRNVIK